MIDFEAGEIFAGRYEIVKELGRGGMGVVYLVIDTDNQKYRALKTLLPKYTASRQAARRFSREVNAARQLSHPCIVKVFDAGKAEDALYYVMEYVEGKSVRTWMRQRKRKTGKAALGIGSTVRVLGMLCSGLKHAHKITIHRDVSPENVMVMRDGQVKLLDFGLAKLDNSDADLTRFGISLGKIQYNAPEQRRDAKNVDSRADIYSLGVMFYEMLSGELPLDGTPLTERVPSLPPEVDDFVARATAEDPEDRIASAEEFREALKEIYEHAMAMEAEEKPAPAPEVAPEPSLGSLQVPSASPEGVQVPVAPLGAENSRGAIRRFFSWLFRRTDQ